MEYVASFAHNTVVVRQLRIYFWLWCPLCVEYRLGFILAVQLWVSSEFFFAEWTTDDRNRLETVTDRFYAQIME